MTDILEKSMPPKLGRGSRARYARAVLFLAGVALAVVLVWRTGWADVQANLSLIGWRFFGFVALYLLAEIAFALGWRSVMDPRPPLSSLPYLLRIYLVGNTLNYLYPGSVAGEPVRVNMLRDRMETHRAIAAMWIFKHAHMLSQSFFVAVGLGIAVVFFDLPTGVRYAALASLALLCGLLILVTWGLQKGSFEPIVAWLCRFKPFAKRLAHYREGARTLDEQIRRFYMHSRPHFFAAAGWCFLGWCGGLLETYLVLRVLHTGRGLETAWAAEALAMLLNNLFLFVPARVGTAESIRTGVFALLGLPASIGVAWGLVRRGRELLWVAPGLVLLGHHASEPSEREEIGEEKRAVGSGQAG
jgi:uncharacterized protein (TIRG00374 family)